MLSRHCNIVVIRHTTNNDIAAGSENVKKMKNCTLQTPIAEKQKNTNCKTFQVLETLMLQ